MATTEPDVFSEAAVEPLPLAEIVAAAGPPLGMPLAEDDDDIDLQRLRAEVVIGGKHVEFGEPPPCPHRQINTETQAALIVDDDGVIVTREVMLRAVCGECGVRFRLVLASARESRTHGELGLVVEVEALEEPAEEQPPG